MNRYDAPLWNYYWHSTPHAYDANSDPQVWGPGPYYRDPDPDAEDDDVPLIMRMK